MGRRRLLALSVLLCLLATACGDYTSGSTRPHLAAPEQVTKQGSVTTIESDLVKRQAPWAVAAVKAVGRESMAPLNFVDEMHGWAAGGSDLYKTADGGKTWVKVNLEAPPASKVASISFINPSHGWVILQNEAADVWAYKENHFRLVQTDDGGATWGVRYEGGESEARRVSFFDEQHGWVVGVKYTGARPVRIPLILNTSDYGRSWVDVSAGVNRLLAEDKNAFGQQVNDEVAEITAEGPLTAVVISARRKLFKTVDGGRSWRQVGSLHDEPMQTRICCLGTQGGERLWVGGGAYSEEGIWGTFIVEQGGHSWNRYHLSGIYLADIVFLSGQEVLACGSIPADAGTAHDSTQIDHSRRDGVVLYSSDGGRSWAIVYRTKRAKTINTLAAINTGNVWAVGDNGLVLQLQPTRNSQQE